MGMAGYTKLFNSILASTIWREDDKTRIVWITLLAMSDKNGICETSIPSLADIARVTLPDCEAALDKLKAPDSYSRTKEHQGRRIEECDGGFRLLNHAKYRAKMSADERREYNRVKQAEHRQKSVSNCQTSSLTVKHVNDSQPKSALSAYTEADSDTKAEAEAEAEATSYSSHSRAALHWLNEKSGRHFRESETSLSVIQARLDEKGVDIEGVKKMIDRQCLMWKGTKMEEYLRPQTLFGKTKFDSYYAAKDLPITTQDKTEKPDYQKGF
jgi:uncharacterized phage protein (TIGR02220 family)